MKQDHEGAPERARRAPLEVLQDYSESGAGGTCFSLTATMLHILRALGFTAEPLLADRPYGQNTHCALAVCLRGVPHLLDPGYLIVKPIPISLTEEVRVLTPFNEVVLKPKKDRAKLELSTLQEGRRTPRIIFKTEPVDASELLSAWDASFDWEMMRYPLLTRVLGGQQRYLQGNRFQVRTRMSVETRRVDAAELPTLVQEQFGIRRALTARALETLERKGEIHAGAFIR